MPQYIGTNLEDKFALSIIDDDDYSVSLGLGNDFARLGNGDDSISGGDGNDTIFGGGGRDLINAGAGNDEIRLGVGDAQVNAGTGNDLIYGAGRNVLNGQDGDDFIVGNGNGTKISGGAGNDTLVGGSGFETINGGEGNDTFLFDANTEQAIINDFRHGEDKIDLSQFGFADLADILDSTSFSGNGSAVIYAPADISLGRMTLMNIKPQDLQIDDFIL